MSDAVEPIITTEYSELSDREMQRAISFMKAVWKLGACRTCGNAHYELMGLAVFRMVGDIATLSDSKAHRRPTATLTCAACGEVRILDLCVAGIIPRPPANPEAKREPGPSSGPYR